MLSIIVSTPRVIIQGRSYHHYTHAVPEKMSEVKKKQKKRNETTNIKQRNKRWLKKAQLCINFPHFFEILIFQNKRHRFSQIPEKPRDWWTQC